MDDRYLTQNIGPITPSFPRDLFSNRYKEQIQYGDGEPKDTISYMVDLGTKRHLCKTMLCFDEPKRIQRDRYSGFLDNTTAIDEAIKRLNEYVGIPVINLQFADYLPQPIELFMAETFTPFIFDVIELQFDELSSGEKEPFRKSINEILKDDCLPFHLSEKGLVDFCPDHDVLNAEIIKQIGNVSEPGLRELLADAIKRHLQPSFEDHKDAVEKLWDAFERLKTFYVNENKKDSADKIIKRISEQNKEIETLINNEFFELTQIGNNYRIRHHETNKCELNDVRHYDYLFNRCLSLIVLAISFL